MNLTHILTNNMNILKKTLLLLLLILFLLLGFYRVTFTNYITFLLTILFDNSQFTQAHFSYNVSYTNIFTIFMSWIDTIIYSFIHSVLIISILYLYFTNKQLTIWVTIFIISLLFFAVLFIILYKITGLLSLYRISEDLIYTTLSPMPLLLGLFLGYLLPFKNNLNQK